MHPNIALETSAENKVCGADHDSPRDDLLQCLAFIAKYYGDERTLASWRQGLPTDQAGASAQTVLEAANHAGFHSVLVQRDVNSIPNYLFPVIALLKDGRACVWRNRLDEGIVEVVIAEGTAETMLPLSMPLAEFAQQSSGYFVLIKPPIRRDDRAGNHLASRPESWFWGTLWQYRSYYYNVVLAAVLVNMLTLAGTFFAINVYDRVIPNQAYITLWALAVGTALAMIFEFSGRQLRSYLVDLAGKKADLVLGAMLFRQMLDVRLESKPPSSGAFANQLREFESLRDFATSATVAALTDLPFVILFVLVISMVGGVLAWVPLAIIPLVILVGWVIQKPLARLMKENMRESCLKHGLLIESIEGMETLKATNGQGFMQTRWDDFSALASMSSLKSRLLTSWANNFVHFVQQIVTVVVIVWGAYLIGEGRLSMGALIGVVILSGRAVSPLAQVVGLAVRYQHAKTSLEVLNGLMAQPTDRNSQQNYLSRSRFEGALRLENIGFSYPQQKLLALDGLNLNIAAGDKIAILGRIGSGKSTLLRVLSGLYLPTEGSVYADNIDLRQIDPADVHHNIGLISQDCKLFYGTLRENIMMASPYSTPEQFLSVAKTTGIDLLAARHPQGYEMQLGESGAGLSGGQRQLVALARCMLAKNPIVLMDEPTSAMDGQTEAQFMVQMQTEMVGRTLILATHRMSLLTLVDRVIVLDNGKLIVDGQKDKVMAALNGGQISVPNVALPPS
jgi:ATP-binding cassette subfamily C protein LapB